MRLSTLSFSHQNRTIPLLRIGATPSNAPKLILINSLQHAREWITVVAVTYALEYLLLNATSVPSVPKSDPFQGVQLLFLPMLNPDGYVYSHIDDSGARLWRKNLRPAPRNIPAQCRNSDNRGVDLNRNWGTDFNGRHASNVPCEDQYAGPRAFSEPETAAVSSLVQRLLKKGGLVAHLDVHSFGQVLLAPWAYKSDAPDRWYELDVVGTAVVNAVIAAEGVRYTYFRGNFEDTIYAASGTMTDWMYSMGVLSFTLELRPESNSSNARQARFMSDADGGASASTYSFELEETQIREVGREVVAAVRTLVEFARDQQGFLELHKLDNDTTTGGGNGTESPEKSESSAGGASSGGVSAAIIAGVAVAAVLSIVVLAGVAMAVRRRRKRGRELVKSNVLDEREVFRGAFGGNEHGLLPRAGAVGALEDGQEHLQPDGADGGRDDDDAFSRASFEQEMLYAGGLPPRDVRGLHMDDLVMEEEEEDDDATVKLDVDSAFLRMLQQQADEDEDADRDADVDASGNGKGSGMVPRDGGVK